MAIGVNGRSFSRERVQSLPFCASLGDETPTAEAQVISTRVPSLAEARQVAGDLLQKAADPFPSSAEFAARERETDPLKNDYADFPVEEETLGFDAKLELEAKTSFADARVINRIIEGQGRTLYDARLIRRKLLAAILGEKILPRKFYVRLNQLMMNGDPEIKEPLKASAKAVLKAVRARDRSSFNILGKLNELGPLVREQWYLFKPEAKPSAEAVPVVIEKAQPKKPAEPPAFAKVNATPVRSSRSTRSSTEQSGPTRIAYDPRGIVPFDTWDGDDD